jgi:hypothetical protein
MQRYGQTIAVTVEDLTRSDDGKAIMSMNNYRNLVRRKQVNILRPGKGLGSCALIEYSSLPERFRRRFESKYGDPEVLLSRDKSALVINAEARRFFAGLEPGTFRLPNGETLPDDKVEEYTLNASVLDALHEEVEKQRLGRNRLKNSTRIVWENILASGGFPPYAAQQRSPIERQGAHL